MHRYEAQIQRAWIVTMTGFWIVLLLVLWSVMPAMSAPIIDVVETRSNRFAPIGNEDLVIRVKADGAIYIRERRVSVAQLVNAFNIAARPREEKPYWRDVFVQVDKRAPFGAVRDVVIAAQRAGRPFLIIVAKPRVAWAASRRGNAAAKGLLRERDQIHVVAGSFAG